MVSQDLESYYSEKTKGWIEEQIQKFFNSKEQQQIYDLAQNSDWTLGEVLWLKVRWPFIFEILYDLAQRTTLLVRRQVVFPFFALVEYLDKLFPVNKEDLFRLINAPSIVFSPTLVIKQPEQIHQIRENLCLNQDNLKLELPRINGVFSTNLFAEFIQTISYLSSIEAKMLNDAFIKESVLQIPEIREFVVSFLTAYNHYLNMQF